MRFVLPLFGAILLSGCSGTPGAPTVDCRTGIEFEPATCAFCPWIDGCPIPSFDADADIQFVLQASYPAGGKAEIRIRNDGDVPYLYRTVYQSCALRYFTDAGREFLIPPGTHCDVANTAPIEPGKTVTLFTWDLDECTKDQWGCAEWKDLPRGTYHIRGTFCAVDAEASYGEDCKRGESESGATVRVG